jgi:hypothetical protein
MAMSRDQTAGRCHNINTDNSSFARVEKFRCLGTSFVNQNDVHEEIKKLREYWLSFGAELLSSSFAIQIKY